MAVLIGAVVTAAGIPPVNEASLGFLVVYSISGSTMIVNDYFDVEVDRVNAPHRPLPKGTIGLREAQILATFWLFIGLSIAWLLGLLPLLVASAVWAVGFLYNWQLKETGFLGNVVTSFDATAALLFGGVILQAPLNPVLWAYSVMTFLAVLGREIVGDMMDVKGDAARDVKSVARVYGINAAGVLAALCFLVTVSVTVIPFLVGWLGVWYLLLISICDGFFVYVSVRLLQGQRSFSTVWRYIYVAMLIATVAFIVGGSVP
jgi:geranylgeranylglycerol-phosphate geranylgeranyltransferase